MEFSRGGKRYKKTHLTAEDCEALARSVEGSSSLTQPLSQRLSTGDVNRRLQPTQHPRRHQGGGVKQFKKTPLTADDCEALAQSMEGSSSLMQPMSQRQSTGVVNRRLQPTQHPRSHQGGQAQQKSITDYFRSSQAQQVGADGLKNSRSKEELPDPMLAEADDSFSSGSTVLDISGDSCSFLEDEDFAPAPRVRSRKRPPSTASARVFNPEQDLWGEPEEKPVVVHPEHSLIQQEHGQIKQELDEMEIEPIPDEHYGLLGTRNWEVPQGTIDKLPVEVLRNIFAFLPVSDLYQNLSLVCHYWRDIVTDPLFIPWKKLYHQYLMKEKTALQRVQQIFQASAILNEKEGCVLRLVRYVSAIPTSRKVNPSAVLHCLKSHHLFSKAEICVVNKLPHLQSKMGPENMWAIITVMVLFSGGVSDIQRLMRCLQSPFSTLSVVDVTEVLYCIATLLYGMRERNIAITNRIHYNIFYCLYLMENASVTMKLVELETRASQCRQDLWASSWPEIQLTHEQQRILNHKIEHGQIVKIMAFAAIMDVVLSQKCGVILVGDPHQQIYTFRGAVRTLSSVPHTHVYYLTQSFRFGPEIAYVGATILDVCKNIRNKILVGGSQHGAVRGHMEGQITLLSRSNMNVFEDAVKLTGREREIKIHVIGGLNRFGLSRIHDIWKLKQPVDQRERANLIIQDSFIKKWEKSEGFWELKDYAKHIDDKDLEVKIAIVEKYKDQIPELVQKIKKSHVSQEALADYRIGTVHQAKGLEFDTVLVADDFVQGSRFQGDHQRRSLSMENCPEDEWNLLYVAVTRAKKCLLLSKTLERILASAGERFLRVELINADAKQGPAIACSGPQCGEMLQPSSRLVVKKLPLTHSNGTKDAGGYLCPACTSQHFGSLAQLIPSPALWEQPL